MRSIIQAFFLFVILATVTNKLYGQKFHSDGTMILSEVSTDPKYGYEADHNTAIKVGSISNERCYLESLRSPDGKPVLFARVGSCCMFHYFQYPSNLIGLLDRYEVSYLDAGKVFVIYLNPYEYSKPKAPLGFSFVSAGDIEKPVIFPKDSVTCVSRCHKRWIYSTKDFLLAEEFGKHPAPDTNAMYSGGAEALLEYFSETPLTDERLKDRTFGIGIGFLVNCEGKAGRFVLLSRGLGAEVTFCNRVLALANKMPQNWKPATKRGKPVDTYQVLYFRIKDGKINDVAYK
jgi:hypothetical protein